MNGCLSLAKEIEKNSFTAVKTSKMLINKGMDADIDTRITVRSLWLGIMFCK
jgi:3-hydroxypropionyl-coenzyme A dehydratase